MVYPTIKRIVEESNGQVAWVMRNYPLESIHPQAYPAASAAECVTAQLGNAGFWKFADDIFANQGALSPTYYEQLATSLGANVATYKACIAADTYKSKIEGESGDAISNGGSGTPYTVVYSKSYQAALPGALPYAQFKAVITSVKNRQ
jgi:protein-disulfide isomerase